MPPRPSLCAQDDKGVSFPPQMPQSVQCGLSAALSFCHTPDVGEKQTGLSQTFLVMSGPRAMQPGLQLWTSSGLDTAAHVHGHREAAWLIPPCHWEYPVLTGLCPKPRSQIRQKWFIKPLAEPFEKLTEHPEVPADTRSFFCPTGSAVSA